jgi:hypothetical protein
MTFQMLITTHLTSMMFNYYYHVSRCFGPSKISQHLFSIYNVISFFNLCSLRTLYIWRVGIFHVIYEVVVICVCKLENNSYCSQGSLQTNGQWCYCTQMFFYNTWLIPICSLQTSQMDKNPYYILFSMSIVIIFGINHKL